MVATSRLICLQVHALNFKLKSDLFIHQDDDDFEDDDSFISLDSTEHSVFKEKSKGMSKKIKYNCLFFRFFSHVQHNPTLFYFYTDCV